MRDDMRERFEEPRAEVVALEGRDVIATSCTSYVPGENETELGS